ncbi:MAG: DNA polymerase III subunit gamma/tau [Pseudomonadota bacterium]
MSEDLATPSEPAEYQVLARKYRPRRFEDLIGHDAMVRTLRNAFASGRIAHAFILTGVRGVGKTTTARILARALNYEPKDGADAGPTVDMPEEGVHCAAIAASRHQDVMEMDAASRTGVADIRELIESVRYAPVEARYKVYIIDEVHMLSTSAFNALLKTLEEPPPHVKFVFATTEIRKVPVTVLSRCQRFDLRRIPQDVLTAHVKNIAEKESAAIAPEALAMIARAAEGSVRDGLSIMDQAIVRSTQNEGEPVSADAVRDMLGLADRDGSWAMLEAALAGDAKTALNFFRVQYDAGADPAQVVRDLLEIVHLLTRVKAAGAEASAHGPAGEAEAARAAGSAEKTPMNALTRAWALLMKGLAEVQSAPDPDAAAEMALIRLAYAADLPTPDEALRALKSGAGPGAGDAAPRQPNGGRGGGARMSAVGGAAPVPAVADDGTLRLQNFDAVTTLARDADTRLHAELQKYVRLVSFDADARRLAFSPADGAPSDLAGRLAKTLSDRTGARWMVSVEREANGAKTAREALDEQIRAHPLVRTTLDLIPGARIIEVRDLDMSRYRKAESVEEEMPDDVSLDDPDDLF